MSKLYVLTQLNNFFFFLHNLMYMSFEHGEKGLQCLAMTTLTLTASPRQHSPCNVANVPFVF